MRHYFFDLDETLWAIESRLEMLSASQSQAMCKEAGIAFNGDYYYPLYRARHIAFFTYACTSPDKCSVAFITAANYSQHETCWLLGKFFNNAASFEQWDYLWRNYYPSCNKGLKIQRSLEDRDLLLPPDYDITTLDVWLIDDNAQNRRDAEVQGVNTMASESVEYGHFLDAQIG
ncbi:hypothetical protein [Spongorhabdus nitratireducens]